MHLYILGKNSINNSIIFSIASINNRRRAQEVATNLGNSGVKLNSRTRITSGAQYNQYMERAQEQVRRETRNPIEVEPEDLMGTP